MDRHTTFGIGGPADRFAVPSGIREFQSLLRSLPQGHPVTVVGAGSNLLVSDRGLRGMVVHTRGLNRVRIQGTEASVGAGVMLPGLLRRLVRRGLGGMEWAAGIPGTVGGAVRMNAGTGEGSMADRVLSVTVLHRSGEIRRVERREMDFGYRRLELPEDLWIVGVRLGLVAGRREVLERRVEEALAARRRTQPLGLRSAGCIFKNPPEGSAGRLIEAAGLKGERVGDAEVSSVHANFIVNRGRARAADVLTLIRKIRRRVREISGITLELEIQVLGETV